MTIIRVGDLIQFTSNEVGIQRSLEADDLQEEKEMVLEALFNVGIPKNSMAVAVRLSKQGHMLFLLCDTQEIVEIVELRGAGISVIGKEDNT